MSDNSFAQLKQKLTAESTRVYKARGIRVKRCPICQMSADNCLCNEHPYLQTNIEFILIFHRDEVFKPTNTGRLIADALPDNTHAFCYSRTEPCEALLKLLQAPDRECIIVFPANEILQRKPINEIKPVNNKKLTFILLDGTWRQGRRMFNSSRWLKEFSVLNLDPKDKTLYATRKAACDSYLSTVESAALALAKAGEENNAKLLFDYFTLFNQRYLQIKSN